MKSLDYAAIAKRLKARRTFLGLTYQELADKASMSKSTLQRYETGAIKNIPIARLQALSSALEMDPNELIGVKTSSSNVTPFSPDLSEDALQVAQDYASLDKPGQRVVKVVIADQKTRVKEEKKQKRSKKYEETEFAGEETGRVIPLYYTPPAAGYASPVFGEDFEYIEVGGDVPAHADFAVTIDGDSMEPYIMNGSTVYVNRDPLQNADVGIFFFDGDMLCKQYYRDEWGNVWLLSLNRARADADKFIEEDSGLTLVCYGRVILPHPLRLAVPETELL